MSHIVPMARLAASVLGADFSRLGEEIQSAVEAGVDIFHLDIMDGHFVPNISFGPDVVRTVNRLTTGFLDVHLMLSQPERYFEAFAEAGADSISFHIKVHPYPVPFVKKIKELGLQAAISLNPNVPFEAVKPYLGDFDMVLLMSVFPGFGGQKFTDSVLLKISEARRFIDDNRLDTLVEVDGGIDAGNAHTIVDAGADILVMGTAFFGSDDRGSLVKLVKGLERKEKRAIL